MDLQNTNITDRKTQIDYSALELLELVPELKREIEKLKKEIEELKQK